MSVQDELHALLEMAVVQGRIEGVTAAVNTIGGFITLVEDGKLGDDWLDHLRLLRNGMSDVILRAELENTARIENA